MNEIAIRNILVPRGKCLLDVIAEMGEDSKTCWHFVQEGLVIITLAKADEQDTSKDKIGFSNGVVAKWNATQEFPETQVVFETFQETEFWIIPKILADDIAFTKMVEKPTAICIYEREE